MRPEGSDGGQKGLADIIRQLGTNEIPRLRVGIGPVPDRWEAADFVLGRFTPAELKTIGDQLVYAAEAVEAWIGVGIDQAMCNYNGARPTE
jgi:PTH1 family peptidyl-tRNA hydrolase